MFTEVLRIKPVLDRAATAVMEQTLTARFTRVARLFGRGLKAAVTGTVFGIGLALLNRILNPIKEVQDRIKDLLGQGEHISDLAEKFGTSTGSIQRIQAVAKSLGVTPDALSDIMSKYAAAVEKAREELQDPTGTISPETRIVKNFVGETDIAKSFLQFLTGLRAEGAGPGRDVFFSDREQRRAAERDFNGEKLSEDERSRLISEGLLKHRSGIESRHAVEQAIFGEKLTGGSRRLVDADFDKDAVRLRLPDEKSLTGKLDKLALLAQQQNRASAHDETLNLVDASDRLNKGIVGALTERDANESKKENEKIDQFASLAKASQGIDELIGIIEPFTGVVVKLLGEIGQVLKDLKAAASVKGLLKRFLQ